MSSILTSHGVMLVTAMAVSGTIILLGLRLQKSFPATQFPLPRSCISSEGKKRERKRKKKKKRVHFAEDVVDPVGNSEEFRRQHGIRDRNGFSSSKHRERRMPANRVALYNGILRDRLAHHRLAFSY